MSFVHVDKVHISYHKPYCFVFFLLVSYVRDLRASVKEGGFPALFRGGTSLGAQIES
jgi:hypothetical protein